MDRTIHYFQDRTELKKSVFQYFQDRTDLKNQFSNMSRTVENVADLNFQYFQDRTD